MKPNQTEVYELFATYAYDKAKDAERKYLRQLEYVSYSVKDDYTSEHARSHRHQLAYLQGRKEAFESILKDMLAAFEG